MFVSGRYIRAIAILIIMGMAFLAFNGSIGWQKVATIIVGFALVFGCKTFAVMLLPSKISGVRGTVNGKVFTPDKSYSSDEIISAACPQL